jgi:hypothetical protein
MMFKAMRAVLAQQMDLLNYQMQKAATGYSLYFDWSFAIEEFVKAIQTLRALKMNYIVGRMMTQLQQTQMSRIQDLKRHQKLVEMLNDKLNSLGESKKCLLFQKCSY